MRLDDHLTAPTLHEDGPGTPLADAGLLFHVDGATEGTTQWRAETFQLVNWGGFEGRVRFDFHRGATLISGASGTGKSTLLDAYIALMMPSDTPFNGASNDAVGGRARSTDQRNLLSYLRGQVDTTADGDGQQTAKVLRGERAATWGAVGMTFVDDHGSRFTALRGYYVPARARRSSEITMRLATHDGALDLAELADHLGSGDQHLTPRSLKSAFPGMRTHDSYASFATTLHARLGIGANGDGTKALRLLVRIQSGQQIRTVDELHKEMVLERPATYTVADRAIEHFDDLESAYRAMQVEHDKAALLDPLPELHERLLAARAEVDTIDALGNGQDGDTPANLWSARTEAGLLDDALDVNSGARSATAADLAVARAAVEHLEGELTAARAEHLRSGGADIERLAADLVELHRLRDDRIARRGSLVDRTTVLGVPLDFLEDVTTAQARAVAFLEAADQVEDELQRARDELRDERAPLVQRRAELVADRESFAGRSGRVPRHLDNMRRQVAAAAAIDPADLPFLAELIDVASSESRWRTAIETVLGASARLLLVPDDQLERFSAAIDPLRLRGRLTFQSVTPQTHGDRAGDPDHVAGKLVLKEHPFSSWVHQHVSDPARNARCVESPAELGGSGYRVTLAGQTRSGTRGSHGRGDPADVIGFSSAEAIAAIAAELAAVEAELERLDDAVTQLDERRAAHARERLAHEAVRAVRFDDIDVGGVDVRIADKRARRQAILGADDTLRALEDHMRAVEERLLGARERLFSLRARSSELDDTHLQLVDRQDAVTRQLLRLADRQVQLSDEQAGRLDAELAAAVAPGDPASLPDLPANLGRLQRRLTEAAARASVDVERSRAELERVLAAFQGRWPDPNLGTTVASYADYARILDDILTTGLHARREEWRRRLTTWSGQDLVPLSGAMDAAVEEIEDRLTPINQILSTLPFGATRDRLRIRLRRLTPEHVTAFRRDLRRLASMATKGLGDSELEQRFSQLQHFMAQLRRRDDPGARSLVSDRDRLLDVRRHVEVTAERYDKTGALLSVHSALGGKSGGETQELVAFIVGAALRFRLGDELRARPRFAPVFLDEGFVKADAEFAGRSVEAWKGLGFQLIVGAPLDKVSALEPHMDDLLVITKDTATGYSFVDRLRDLPA